MFFIQPPFAYCTHTGAQCTQHTSSRPGFQAWQEERERERETERQTERE
eukprot:COSAG02_NODE_7941_length_2777_cov_2.056385_1_plen_48_part_10